MSLFELFGRQKMNIYIYGPKDDAYHKSKWREEYPTELGAKITQYVNAAKAHKIDFVWAIHPGEDIQWNDTNRNNIVNKLKAMCRLGVRNFAVFWDDLWNDDGTHGDEQAELMNYIATEIEAEYPDVNPMIICPTQYNRASKSKNICGLCVCRSAYQKSLLRLGEGFSIGALAKNTPRFCGRSEL